MTTKCFDAEGNQISIEEFKRATSAGGSYPEYGGMSYMEASREAERLIKRRGWYQSFYRLAALRDRMEVSMLEKS